MRFQAHVVCGLSLLVVTAGCAASRHTSDDVELWSWETSTAAPATQSRQYNLAGSPQQRQYAGKSVSGTPADEFKFSHPRVDDFLTRFQTNLRSFYTDALSRSGRYVPRMLSILQKEGLPQELAYLPLIESGFRTQAVSPAGAVGPWQMIPGTGRRYGLRIDHYVDERRDPVKSTHAAAKYLKALYAMFGNWHLSLAAYNTGEGKISRILEAGNADDFWEMSDRGYLYRETEDYVPEFLAAVQIAQTPEAYGFETPETALPSYDLVTIKRPLSLSTVARLSGASTDEIKELNPALQRGVVPPQGYAVRLPKGSKGAFQVALASYREPPAPARHKIARRMSGRHVAVPRAKRGAQAHRVRRGETLASIAAHHNVPVQALAKANGIRNARTVQAGKTLRVPKVASQDGGPVVTASRKGRGRVLD